MNRSVSRTACSAVAGIALLLCVLGCRESNSFPQTTQSAAIAIASTPVPTQAADPLWVQEQLTSRLCDAINQAELTMHKTILKESAQLKSFILDRKQRSKEFSEAMLSWSGQWAYLQSKLGVGGRKQDWLRYTFSKKGEIKASLYSDPLEDFLKEQFESCILKPSEIQEEMERLVKRLEAHFKVIENDLLLRVQKDVEDLKAVEVLQFKHLTDNQAFRSIYAEQLKRSMDQASLTIPADMARSFIASDIGFFIGVRLSTTLATRLGISGAASGLGLAGNIVSGGATLALGFAGASLFDDLVKEMLKHWFNYDPEGDIAGQVELTLTSLANQLFGSFDCAKEMYVLHVCRDYVIADKDYPLQQVRERLDETFKKMERNRNLGLDYHLVQFMHSWSLSRQTSLLKTITGRTESTEPMQFLRWPPGKQPTLEEVNGRCAALWEKWGNN